MRELSPFIVLITLISLSSCTQENIETLSYNSHIWGAPCMKKISEANSKKFIKWRGIVIAKKINNVSYLFVKNLTPDVQSGIFESIETLVPIIDRNGLAITKNEKESIILDKYISFYGLLKTKANTKSSTYCFELHDKQ